jgi:hypothetical protein
VSPARSSSLRAGTFVAAEFWRKPSKARQGIPKQVIYRQMREPGASPRAGQGRSCDGC